jgi:hypothetical protein
VKRNLVLLVCGFAISLAYNTRLNAQSINKDLLAPEIVIVSPASSDIATKADTIIFRGIVLSYKLPLSEIVFLLNGNVLEKKKPGPESGFRYSFQVPIKLVPGRNKVTIIASNAKSQSTATSGTITFDSAPSSKPRLATLSIGLSTYADASLNSSFREQDAARFAAQLAQQRSCVYDVVPARVLVGREATRSAVLQGLDWLNKAASSPEDVRVVFISGHFARDDTGRYYLLSSLHETESDLELTDIRSELLWSRLKAAPGRVLLFLDQALARPNPQAMAQTSMSLANNITAIVSPAASSRFGARSANDGAFATALLEGLSKNADSSGDRVVDMNELLRWVQKRYPEITRSKLAPTLWGELDQKPTPVFCIQ